MLCGGSLGTQHEEALAMLHKQSYDVRRTVAVQSGRSQGAVRSTVDNCCGSPVTAGVLCCADLYQRRLRQRQETEDAALARNLHSRLQHSSRKLQPKPRPTQPTKPEDKLHDPQHSKEALLNRSKTGAASNSAQAYGLMTIGVLVCSILWTTRTR